MIDTYELRVKAALTIAYKYGGSDGADHKAWVIDQMVRTLAWNDYDAWVKDACNGENGPDTYTWDCGIAP